jgi:hypothetical protein
MNKYRFDHIEGKLGELRFFKTAMEEMHRSYEQHAVRLRRFDEDMSGIAKRFSYYFSAFLSAHRAIRYYIIRLSNKVPGTADWRRSLDDNPVLDALHHLRDVAIHDETLNLASTTTVGAGAGNPDIKWSGLMLHDESLNNIRRFLRRPDAITYLTSKPILQIAEDAFREILKAIEEGRQKGYLD